MTVTFLVEINLEDVSDLAGEALDIADDLSSNFDVISVKPWQRPITAPLISPESVNPK